MCITFYINVGRKETFKKVEIWIDCEWRGKSWRNYPVENCDVRGKDSDWLHFALCIIDYMHKEINYNIRNEWGASYIEFKLQP